MSNHEAVFERMKNLNNIAIAQLSSDLLATHIDAAYVSKEVSKISREIAFQEIDQRAMVLNRTVGGERSKDPIINENLECR